MPSVATAAARHHKESGIMDIEATRNGKDGSTTQGAEARRGKQTMVSGGETGGAATPSRSGVPGENNRRGDGNGRRPSGSATTAREAR